MPPVNLMVVAGPQKFFLRLTLDKLLSSVDTLKTPILLRRLQETRTLAVGDRLQFRARITGATSSTGSLRRFVALTHTGAKLSFKDRGRQVTLPYQDLRHVDYGYTVTSLSSQGSTVDRVIVNDDSMRSARLVNREQAYVSISRAHLHE